MQHERHAAARGILESGAHAAAGTGVRVLFKDWLTAHLDMRDHILDVDVFGANKTTHTYEATLGLTALF